MLINYVLFRLYVHNFYDQQFLYFMPYSQLSLKNSIVNNRNLCSPHQPQNKSKAVKQHDMIVYRLENCTSTRGLYVVVNCFKFQPTFLVFSKFKQQQQSYRSDAKHMTKSGSLESNSLDSRKCYENLFCVFTWIKGSFENVTLI